MKSVVILLMLLSVLSVSNAHAKRGAAAKVPAVMDGALEYRAPTSEMGCVEAWNTKSQKMVWRRQIYIVKYDVGLEKDVQDIFINSLKLRGNVLIVTNERKSMYQLDLDSLNVKVLKGALIETK
ncbi:MAG: hypothetical protein L7W43_18850 [Rubripirellula sp.]|nr:hypothetical protein [Rubripirellula sp.]